MGIIIGTPLSDVLVGADGPPFSLTPGPAADTIYGGAGDDTIRAGIGFDLVFGGAGIDTLLLAPGEQSAILNDGDGSLPPPWWNDDGWDFVYEVENVIGSSAADGVTGSSGPNKIAGMGGADTIDGGAGDDDINGNQGDDVVHGGAGADWVVGGQGADLLFGDAGADLVYGNLGDDTAYGGDGDDTVRGGQGNDVLDGGVGDDWLAGDIGDDTLTGGTGADTFFFSVGAGHDRITDFSFADGDLIFVERPGFTIEPPGYRGGIDMVIRLETGESLTLASVAPNIPYDFFYTSAGRFRSTTWGDDVIQAGPYADIIRAFGGVDQVFGFGAGDQIQVAYGETYSLAQVGANAVATLGNGSQMILVGVSLSALPDDWIQHLTPWDY